MHSKVAQITALFWVMKIFATTLGETAADWVSMTLGLGYTVSTFILLGAFAVTVTAQIAVRRFYAPLYWLVILATTMAGTTISDYLDRTAHLGYLAGSALIAAALIAVLASWKLTLGDIAVTGITTKPAEAFYWTAILASNTLGTALGDSLSDTAGLGYQGGALLIAAALAIILALHLFTTISKTALFWAAFILTRPLGATVGDLLTKPLANGGLNLGTASASMLLGVAFLVLMAVAAWQDRKQNKQAVLF